MKKNEVIRSVQSPDMTLRNSDRRSELGKAGFTALAALLAMSVLSHWVDNSQEATCIVKGRESVSVELGSGTAVDIDSLVRSVAIAQGGYAENCALPEYVHILEVLNHFTPEHDEVAVTHFTAKGFGRYSLTAPITAQVGNS